MTTELALHAVLSQISLAPKQRSPSGRLQVARSPAGQGDGIGMSVLYDAGASHSDLNGPYANTAAPSLNEVSTDLTAIAGFLTGSFDAPFEFLTIFFGL
jgi:hypothetical protein